MKKIKNKEKVSRSRGRRRGLVFGILGAVFVVAIVEWVGCGSRLVAEKQESSNRGLAVMNIELNGVELAEINEGDKKTKYGGNELSLYENGEVVEFSDVEIRGRGNTTWAQEKKPYQIKFNRAVDLLGSGKAKKWVLLANALDASLMRNDVALHLAEILEVEYNFRGEFIELYFNGEYNGVYYLVQKVEIAKGSVDLREEGGVLFEVDTLHKEQEKCYTSYLGECLVLKDIVSNDVENEEEAAAEFMEGFNRLELAAEEGDYEGVMKEIDVLSFVNYFLVNEFTVNPDAYSSSFYFYKDGVGDKIHAGPVWDFDYALGNQQWLWRVDEKFFSPDENMVRKREVFGDDSVPKDLNISKLFYYLMEIPEFRDEVRKVFQERMMGREGEFVKVIYEIAGRIREAAEVDGERWGMEDFWAEVEGLVEWVRARYGHFEVEYGDGGGAGQRFL